MISIHLWDNRKKYEYRINLMRKITIIRGDSGRGKSTFLRLVEESQLDTGIHLSCTLDCIPLPLVRWRSNDYENSVVIIDEGHPLLRSGDELNFINENNCYFVFITRQIFTTFSYRPEDVYNHIVYDNIHTLVPAYALDDSMYEKPDIVITEDSNAGYDFFSSLWQNKGIFFIGAGSNSKIARRVEEQAKPGIVMLVIADDFAFGSKIEALLGFIESGLLRLFLPKSFEWILLSSKMFYRDNRVKRLIDSPETAIPFSELNCETYVTNILKNITKFQPCAYKKESLKPCYKYRCCNVSDGPCRFEIHGEKLQLLFEEYSKLFPFMLED